jgi:gluconolactonase
VASMKPLQCVALVAVLIQSLSVVDAGARAAEDARAVSTTIASDVSENTSAALKVDRLDPGIDMIVPPNATMERVATGFTWVEGPIWIPAGYLLFAEITSNSIRKLTPDGKVSIFLQPSGYKGTAPYGGKEPGSNGMTLDRSVRLTVAGHARRDVWRLETLNPKGQVTVLADSFEGKKLNSPNDLVYKSDGSLYFTDPPYGLPTQGDSDPIKELQVSGVYRIPKAFDQKPGTAPQRDQLQLLVKDLPRPNGIAFSPDERYLYVANSGSRKVWMRYRVKEDGTLTDAKVFYDASSDTRPGGPDGMKVDREGNVYSTGPGGVWIFSPEGKPLGVILTPERAANVNWGGADRKTLYITASSSIYRVTLKVPGV